MRNPAVTDGFLTQRTNNAEIWFCLCCWSQKLLNQQLSFRSFGTDWRACDVTVMTSPLSILSVTLSSAPIYVTSRGPHLYHDHMRRGHITIRQHGSGMGRNSTGTVLTHGSWEIRLQSWIGNFEISIKKKNSWAFPAKSASGECRNTSLSICPFPSNVDLDICCHMASLGHNEFIPSEF